LFLCPGTLATLATFTTDITFCPSFDVDRMSDVEELLFAKHGVVATRSPFLVAISVLMTEGVPAYLYRFLEDKGSKHSDYSDYTHRGLCRTF